MFALYQQYGVPKEEGKPAIDIQKTEAAIREAFVADPDTLRPVFNQEIALHRPFVARDHSCRVYVQMLNRILGAEGEDVFAEHDRQVKEALSRLPAQEKPALDVTPILAKEP